MILDILLAAMVMSLAGTIRVVWRAYVSVSRRCLELMDELERLEAKDG